MTNLEYLKTQLSKFGVSDAELEAALVPYGVDPFADLSTDSARLVNAAIYDYIPQMLAGLQDVSEGDYSMKWNFDGIRLWYSVLASKLGKPNLVDPSSVTDISNLW